MVEAVAQGLGYVDDDHPGAEALHGSVFGYPFGVHLAGGKVIVQVLVEAADGLASGGVILGGFGIGRVPQGAEAFGKYITTFAQGLAVAGTEVEHLPVGVEAMGTQKGQGGIGGAEPFRVGFDAVV